MTHVHGSGTISRASRQATAAIGKATSACSPVLLLILIAIILLTPLAWLVSTALKEQAQIFTYPPEWIPNPVLWSNFREVDHRSIHSVVTPPTP